MDVFEDKQATLLASSVEELCTLPFPLAMLLSESVYYPSSGTDGDPIKHLSKRYISFVYADYGMEESALLERIRKCGFLGYRPLLERKLTNSDLELDSLDQLNPMRELLDDGGRYCFVNPYAIWFVFERIAIFGEEHGPQRFSLLFLAGDGPTVYKELYIKRATAPGLIAIIQPGTGFGGNYTDFDSRSDLLASLVLDTDVVRPPRLLNGGRGSKKLYQSPCWPEYRKHICDFERYDGRGSIRLWQM
jgi:hypothetical protein